MEISKDLAELIQGLSQAVLKKDAKELTKAEAAFLVSADIMSLPTEITVSTNDTRKTEVQYCTNTYGGTIKISLQNLVSDIRTNTLDTIDDPVAMVSKYLELKAMYIKFIQFKYESMESMLRNMSREAQKKDKIVPVGRYNE